MLGFLPRLWWCFVFGRVLFSRKSDVDRLSTGMLRGVLIAFFLASLFGVPSQSTAITLTFWILAFWMLLEADPNGAATPAKWSSKPWLATAVVVIAVECGATAAVAFGEWRRRVRAHRFDS